MPMIVPPLNGPIVPYSSPFAGSVRSSPFLLPGLPCPTISLPKGSCSAHCSFGHVQALSLPPNLRWVLKTG